MPRRFSLLLFGFAILIGLFIIFFIHDYFPFIHADRGNTLTKVGFFLINAIGMVFIIILMSFQKWIYKKRKNLFFSLTVFLIGIVTIEAFLQIAYKRPLRFSPHPYLNYIGTPYYKSADGLNIHNSLGMRGPEIEMPKPKGRIRIAILGGSTAYEEAVRDWKKDFARRLERDLTQALPNRDIEVINAGLPGWDSWEDLVNLEFRLLDFDLDMIIPYEGVNDVHARLVTPLAYKGDNTGSKVQWNRKPCLILLCLKTVQLITGFEPYNFDISAPTYTQPKASSYNTTLGMTPIAALEKNPPIYFERNLRNIIAIAIENGIHVMLATWAWSNQFSDLAATIHYQQGFREHNEVVKKIGKAKNIPVYDFALEMPMDRKYWTEGLHNNEEGVSVKAKLFANYITQNKIIEDLEKNK